MELKCPGRKANELIETALVTCSACGQPLEIFGDEARVHCRCGQWVFREIVPSCAQWCSSAERCFGDVGTVRQMLHDVYATDDPAEQKKRLKLLQMRIAHAQTQCAHPEEQHRAPAARAEARHDNT